MKFRKEIGRKFSKTFLAVLHSRALLYVQLQMSVLFVVPDLGISLRAIMLKMMIMVIMVVVVVVVFHVKDDDDEGS